MQNYNIIAFGGYKNTGKDTSANMLRFILNTPKILHFYWIYKYFNFLGNFGKWKVTSFARPLKEVLSIILGVPVENFENGDFKSLTDEEIENYTKELKKRSYKWNDLNEVEL